MSERVDGLRLLKAPFWNSDERRLRALWRLLGFGMTAALLGWGALATGLPARLRDLGASATGAVLVLAIDLLSLWLTARLFERRPLTDSGLGLDASFLRELGLGLGLGAVLMSSVFAVEKALGWVSVSTLFRQADPVVPFPLAFLTPLVVFVSVGIYEEAVFRGLLMRTLAEGLSSRRVPPRTALVLAALLSSAAFALAHARNPNATVVSTLNIAVVGMVLCLPYLITARLALSIGLHISWNLFQGNVYGFPVSGTTRLPTTVIAVVQRGPDVWTGGAFGPEGGLLGLLAVAVGAVAIVLVLRPREGFARIQEALAAPPSRPGSRLAEAAGGPIVPGEGPTLEP
jgi:membrane protease YdiL (CAAX protease family)